MLLTAAFVFTYFYFGSFYFFGRESVCRVKKAARALKTPAK